MKKLTLVSVVVNGQRRAVFVPCDYVEADGKTKAVVDWQLINHLTRDLARGQTYTLG